MAKRASRAWPLWEHRERAASLCLWRSFEAERAARQDRTGAALGGYELAPGLDPLDFAAQERYWPLTREPR